MLSLCSEISTTCTHSECVAAELVDCGVLVEAGGGLLVVAEAA